MQHRVMGAKSLSLFLSVSLSLSVTTGHILNSVPNPDHKTDGNIPECTDLELRQPLLVWDPLLMRDPLPPWQPAKCPLPPLVLRILSGSFRSNTG